MSGFELLDTWSELLRGVVPRVGGVFQGVWDTASAGSDRNILLAHGLPRAAQAGAGHRAGGTEPRRPSAIWSRTGFREQLLSARAVFARKAVTAKGTGGFPSLAVFQAARSPPDPANYCHSHHPAD